MQCFEDLNNRWTGEHATKPLTLGLLGHSVYMRFMLYTLLLFKDRVFLVSRFHFEHNTVEPDEFASPVDKRTNSDRPTQHVDYRQSNR